MNYKTISSRKTQKSSEQTDRIIALKIIRLANNYKHHYKNKFYHKISKDLSIRIE